MYLDNKMVQIHGLFNESRQLNEPLKRTEPN
jgi:hypothetical protein